jgi:hypothetical protein
MIFNFNHSENDYNSAIGVSKEELNSLEQKWNIFIGVSIEILTKESNMSLSKITEMLDSEFSKEELSILLAKLTKERIITFFSQYQDLIPTLLLNLK